METESLSTELETLVQQLSNTNTQSANHTAATQCIQVFRYDKDDLLFFKLSTRMGKKGDLNDFEQVLVVSARWADLLGFSYTMNFGDYREWFEREKYSVR